jgi:CBS domain-containing protein
MLIAEELTPTSTDGAPHTEGNLRDILRTKHHKGVLSVSPKAPILEAVDKLCEAHVGALLVLDQGRPVGIVSERDLLTRVLLRRRDPVQTRVADVMTRDVIAIRSDATSDEAMAIMTERRCRHLPVIEDDAILGIVSIGDLVRWISHAQAYQIQTLEEYVCGKYPG